MLGNMDTKATPTIRDLYPQLSDKDLALAEDNIERYLALVLTIFERLESEAAKQAGKLTPKTGTLPCTPTSGPDNSA